MPKPHPHRQTLASAVSVTGIGLHSGAQVSVTLQPAPAGHGIVFIRTDTAETLPIAPENTQPTALCTLLTNAQNATLSTVEHLMAAFAGLGVTDVSVHVNGPELPILDGSALPWVQAIDTAGRAPLAETITPVIVTKPQLYSAEGRLLEALPDPRSGTRIMATIEFPHPAIGRQSWKGVLDEQTFRTEIAPARTFTLERDVNAARAAGLIKGGSLENAVVFADNGTVLNPEGLRFADEPVRHKVLDALGDFYMAGRPVWGKLILTLPGHSANNALLRNLLK